MIISEKARAELLDASHSEALKSDMRKISEYKHDYFFKDGRIDTDSYLDFVTQFNSFINHLPKPLKRIKEVDMKL